MRRERKERRLQAARFGSWMISFRREVMSGSIHQRSVGEWLAEIHVTTIMDDLKHSEFAFDDNPKREFETLDSNRVKEIAKIIPQEFWRKIDLLDE